MSSASPALSPLPGRALRFQKVEDFYSGYRSWPRITDLESWSFDKQSKTLSLELCKSDQGTCGALIQFLQANTLRLRFNPGKDPEAFTRQNSRSVVMDTAEELRIILERDNPFTVEVASTSTQALADIVTRTGDGKARLGVRIEKAPFRVTISDIHAPTPFVLWQTDDPALFFAFNGDRDFSIAHAIRKSPTARYIGFGEHGGRALVKNTEQVNFFDFDNMKYRQVYNQGPLDGREPLYHSDPFFMEFNGNPFNDSVYGVFLDNPAQCYVDIGYDNSARYVLGTRFGDLDFYFIAGANAAEVLQGFTQLIGRSRLKPRYALGYHQGCYGYENWNDVLDAVNQYRSCRIPIDGIHIDVDIQDQYQTFTVDQSPNKFPNAKDAFAALRNNGVKCSTNITPIISNRRPDYTTYQEGLRQGFFVADKRFRGSDPETRQYQNFNSGFESAYPLTDPENNFNSGRPYIGEVYYGGDRGTTGHYADLGRRKVRDWWGTQYQGLFDLGLEMIWQDMTTPAIRDTRGDMRGFPFRLQLTDDFLSNAEPQQNEAIRVWNLYSYNLHKATYHGLNALRGRENKRNFIVGRGSFTGMHRFAALWTGDNASTWEFLQINVAQVLSLGMCGIAICGEDIGGFEAEFDWQQWAGPELLMRWTMAGAFLPWFRNHYIRKGRKRFQEPFMYQTVDINNVFPVESRKYYGMALPVCQLYIERRYRLLQLMYDAMWENTLNGMPICRSMILTDSQDKALYNDKVGFLDNQFMIRNDLLVAPLLEPESQQNAGGRRDIYLPAGGRWYCYMDNRLPLAAGVEGGTTVRGFDAGLYLNGIHERFLLPMYVRAGAILPTIELEQYIGERAQHGQMNPTTLNVYPGEKGKTYTYTMYLDDGVSRSSAPKRPKEEGGDAAAMSEYREVLVTHTPADGVARQVRIERRFDGYTPIENFLFVAILQDPSEPALSTVRMSGASLQQIAGGSPEDRADRLAASGSNAWYYNENLRIAFVKIFDQAKPIVVDVS